MEDMEIHVHVHQSSILESKIDRILEQQGVMMAKVDELKAELVAANETTNEIANDVADLLTKLVEGGLSAAEADEVKAQIVALNERLKGVAAQHTPGSAQSADSTQGR